MNGYHGMACRSTEETLDFSELLPPREMQSLLLFCFVECWDRAYTTVRIIPGLLLRGPRSPHPHAYFGHLHQKQPLKLQPP